MSEVTKIEWTDSTFNGWIGCTKVSPACDHCYAERSTPARTLDVEWGAHAERHKTSIQNWRKPISWNDRPFLECRDCGWRGDRPAVVHGLRVCPAIGCASTELAAARRRVFCASLSDVFDNAVPPTWRAERFELIERTPNLDWILLTKRIGNVKRMLLDTLGTEALPDNVWLGVTIANQAEADRDIEKLLMTHARVRFLSIEPMLGPVDLQAWFDPTGCCCMREMQSCEDCPADAPWIHGPTTEYADDGSGYSSPEIDWVIVGGESGPGARPMHPDWARDLRDQCADAGVPFLFKQWGEWIDHDQPGVDMLGTVHSPLHEWPDGKHSVRLGKRAAGRNLDGRTHDEFPHVR
ncbi:phage Gp37/Gp68 family protein [Burkholderia ambifaria]|uniref:phage Gp37/Gp68 family protein n=1 Tax=Burkholderia ambifaria TaxID=152480 RepID=UPI00158F1678|nr:phage Gp37/Gp68 family protein [Burkholderia ambifaria]